MKGVNETTVINVTTCGLQKGPLAERLARKLIRTVMELFKKWRSTPGLERIPPKGTG